MSCYNPILGVPDYDKVNESGKVSYKLLGKYDPSSAQIIDPGCIPIPCGKCIGCRLDYSRSWADRMILEMDHSKKAIFLTLTYDNDHVPFIMDPDTDEFRCLSLDKRDLQLFFKRLRKCFGDRNIRFYAAGEYGSNTYRPHYHAIVFGLGLDDFSDLQLLGKNELGQPHFMSDQMTSIWKNGFCVLAEVNWKTCAYVSRYVQKKVTHSNDSVLNFMEIDGAIPEFSLMSRRPGIGAYYLEDHKDAFDLSEYYVKGQKIKIPKYFLKKLELINPDRFAMIKEQRKECAKDAVLLKMMQTDLSFTEQLEQEENYKMLKTSILRRCF